MRRIQAFLGVADLNLTLRNISPALALTPVGQHEALFVRCFQSSSSTFFAIVFACSRLNIACVVRVLTASFFPVGVWTPFSFFERTVMCKTRPQSQPQLSFGSPGHW